MTVYIWQENLDMACFSFCVYSRNNDLVKLEVLWQKWSLRSMWQSTLLWTSKNWNSDGNPRTPPQNPPNEHSQISGGLLYDQLLPEFCVGKSTEKQFFNTAKQGCLLLSCTTGWWFGTFFIFHFIYGHPSHWLSYFSRWLLHHQPDNFCLTLLIRFISQSNVATGGLELRKSSKGG